MCVTIQNTCFAIFFSSKKMFITLVCGATIYWLFGFSFAFGGDGDEIKGNGDAFIGHDNFALSDLPEDEYATWFFQFVFAATAATIVSGAIAERAEFIAYLVYSALITGNTIIDTNYNFCPILVLFFYSYVTNPTAISHLYIFRKLKNSPDNQHKTHSTVMN